VRFFIAVSLSSVLLAVANGSAHADGSSSPLSDVDLADFNAGNGDSAVGHRWSEYMNEGIETWNSTSDVGNRIQSGLDLLDAVRDAFSPLSLGDAELDSRMTDVGGPEVPTSCSGGEECAACYTRAYGEVNFTRATLERLRTIYRITTAYIQRAEGFGDSVSGVHGISGLSWQYAKGGIEQERATFNHLSHEKGKALLENMRRALDMVAECEAKYYNNPDWYNRYGFMYYNFIVETYNIPE